MKTTPPAFLTATRVAILAFILTAASRHTLASITFSGGSGTDGSGNYDYNSGGNWTGGSVPDLKDGGVTALINDGLNVNYYGSANGDFFIGNGSTLEISSGSWNQASGGNYIQMTGNAAILVDGGYFNQGSDSANPFNLGGSVGNSFTISSGSATFTNNTNLSTGFTWLQSGGTVNVTGNELDYNSFTASMSGGILNANLITGVNAGSDAFNFSGGTINLSSGTGIYGGQGGTQALNFTLASTGVLNFTGGLSVGQVEMMINSGVIDYNSTIDTSTFVSGVSNDFVVSQSGGTVSVTEVAPAPEPSVFASVAVGAGALLAFRRQRRRK